MEFKKLFPSVNIKIICNTPAHLPAVGKTGQLSLCTGDPYYVLYTALLIS